MLYFTVDNKSWDTDRQISSYQKVKQPPEVRVLGFHEGERPLPRYPAFGAARVGKKYGFRILQL